MSETATGKFDESNGNESGSGASHAGSDSGESTSESRLNDSKAAAPEETDWKSKYLYLVAEMDNLKKRNAKERLDLIQNANEGLLNEIFPVVDNLELAVKAIKNAEPNLDESVKNHSVYRNMVMGVEMTLKHFKQTLEQVGVKEIESLGKPFDPTVHQAMGETELLDRANGEVSTEMQKGYSLHGRVIRTARVLVNKVETKAKS